MPARIVVGGNGAKATFLEWTGANGTGQNVAPIGPVSFASSNVAVATVDAQGNVTAVAANADGSDASATITGADAGNGLTARDVITVGAAAPAKAVSATLTLAAN